MKIKMDNSFEHHGVLGMRWGIRRYQPYPKGHRVKGGKEIGAATKVKQRPTTRSKTKTTTSKKVSEKKEEPKKLVKDMTEDELKAAISRMKLEKEFRDLMKQTTPVKSKKGREFIEKIFWKGADDIGGQLSSVAMGTAVNKIARALIKDLDKDIVNPYKATKAK